jgi:hypothetical protein
MSEFFLSPAYRHTYTSGWMWEAKALKRLVRSWYHYVEFHSIWHNTNKWILSLPVTLMWYAVAPLIHYLETVCGQRLDRCCHLHLCQWIVSHLQKSTGMCTGTLYFFSIEHCKAIDGEDNTYTEAMLPLWSPVFPVVHLNERFREDIDSWVTDRSSFQCLHYLNQACGCHIQETLRGHSDAQETPRHDH